MVLPKSKSLVPTGRRHINPFGVINHHEPGAYKNPFHPLKWDTVWIWTRPHPQLLPILSLIQFLRPHQGAAGHSPRSPAPGWPRPPRPRPPTPPAPRGGRAGAGGPARRWRESHLAWDARLHGCGVGFGLTKQIYTRDLEVDMILYVQMATWDQHVIIKPIAGWSLNEGCNRAVKRCIQQTFYLKSIRHQERVEPL